LKGNRKEKINFTKEKFYFYFFKDNLLNFNEFSKKKKFFYLDCIYEEILLYHYPDFAEKYE
jgi:hypothetical protein